MIHRRSAFVYFTIFTFCSILAILTLLPDERVSRSVLKSPQVLMKRHEYRNDKNLSLALSTTKRAKSSVATKNVGRENVRPRTTRKQTSPKTTLKKTLELKKPPKKQQRKSNQAKTQQLASSKVKGGLRRNPPPKTPQRDSSKVKGGLRRNPPPKTKLIDMALSVWKKKSQNQKKVHLLLLCYWRGGSTFLSDILQHHQTAFYTFEPFHFMNSIQLDTVPNEVQRILHNLMQCNYKNLTGLMDWMKTKKNQWLMRWNKQYWRVCRLKYGSCFNPALVSRVCSISALNIIKTIRIRLLAAKTLLDQPPEGTNVKVIHLVRDPRGMFQSRKRAEESYGNYTNIEEMCTDLSEDYKISNELKQTHSDRFLQIRYEDLSKDPFEMTEKILKFAGVNLDPRVLKHLNYITKAKDNDLKNQYSTKRNSSTNWYNWRNKIDIEDVLDIQSQCSPVMEELRYRMADQNETLQEFYPLVN